MWIALWQRTHFLLVAIVASLEQLEQSILDYFFIESKMDLASLNKESI